MSRPMLQVWREHEAKNKESRRLKKVDGDEISGGKIRHTTMHIE